MSETWFRKRRGFFLSFSLSDTPHYENVPFEIPNSWVWTTIEEICSKIGSGSTPRGSNYSANGIPFFRSQNVYNDRLVYDDIKYISEEVHQKMKGTEVLANDLLLNITGGSLGRCAVVPADFNCGNVSQHVCIMRSVLVEPEYFHALVLSSYFAKSMKITGSGREGLPKYSLEQMAFPLPPLSEQQRIVMEIEKLFALIDQIEHSKVNLQTIIKQTKSKILDLAIHGKLVPQDPNDEPAIELLKRINPDFTPCDNGHYAQLPNGWTTIKVGDVAIYTNGRAFKPEDWMRQGLPIIRIQNLNDKSASYNRTSQTYESRYLIHNGDLLFAWAASLGTYVWNGGKAWLNQHIFKVEPYPFIEKQYLYHVFKAMITEFYTQSHGSGMVHITKKQFENIKLLLPPLEEQKRIVQTLEQISTKLDEIMESL